MDEQIKDMKSVENLDLLNECVGLDIQDAIIEDMFIQSIKDEEYQKDCSKQANELEEIILGCECACGENDCDLVETNNQEVEKEINNKTEKSFQELENYFNSIKCQRVVAVYAKVNKEGYITELVSDIFTKNLEGYVKIDEGDGDKFVYPENNYFGEPLVDDNGNYRYKF